MLILHYKCKDVKYPYPQGYFHALIFHPKPITFKMLPAAKVNEVMNGVKDWS